MPRPLTPALAPIRALQRYSKKMEQRQSRGWSSPKISIRCSSIAFPKRSPVQPTFRSIQLNKLHTAYALCQLQIRNVDRARFDGPGPLFPTAPLLSSPMCPEGDRRGSFKTRCRIALHLPAKMATTSVQRCGSPVRSAHRQSAAPELPPARRATPTRAA